MLRKTGRRALALTLSIPLSVGLLSAPVHAEEHYVLMMGIGYFPDYVYPTVGDTIRFVNNSDLAMSAVATDDSWSTGLLQPGEQSLIDVVAGMQQSYGDLLTEGSTVAGVVDYTVEPPLDLERNLERNHEN
ncbi:MAG: cupredoxin domain-containing protein [Salipiger thiooxidans]|uniref:cupredoxin domain-containing protein n=1 Tax=Salipiger thiooxidans TaxID=282683 RepID=UPI001CF9A292|nr:hypothetical protein [Salipiger thiooxidans]